MSQTDGRTHLLRRVRASPPRAKIWLTGARRLRAAFLAAPVRSTERGRPLFGSLPREPQVALLQTGFAYRACGLANGRRAIVDILIPRDVIGLDRIVMQRTADEFVSTGRLSYRVLGTGEVRRLMADPTFALHVAWLLAESRGRAYRLATSLGRLDAHARICVMLLDLYKRLRRRDLIARPTFNLPLTQEQIADHLGLTVVHVNRMLRRLREKNLTIVDRQVVIILDLPRLRGDLQGFSAAEAEIAEPVL